MELMLWWMIPALLLAGSVVAGVMVLARRGKGRSTGAPVAHTERLTMLPGYRRALARYRVLLGGLAAAAVLLFAAAAVLAARPTATATVYPQTSNRDIVLCLDVSGSMVDVDAALVDVFSSLAGEFDGERISLVVFNASAVTYFPLTSDYGYVRDQLVRIGAQFAGADGAYFDGTFFGDGSSLIGDGLAACALRFDTPDADRSRSIILATDNLEVGRSIFTLPEAGALASERGIRIYGINPGDTSAKDYLAQYATEFEQMTVATGGAYYSLGDPDAIPAIVDGIEQEQATVMRGAPQLVASDRPVLPAVLAFLGLGALFAIAWRVRL